MLWESVDPPTELARRFGFADAGQATEWLAATLARHWDIRVAGCERLVISAGNALAWIDTDAGRLIAKWSIVTQYFPKLARQARLTAWLGERGQPVSAPIPSTSGSPQVEVDGVSIGLQRVVDGTWLDVADPGQVHRAGAVLAELHSALADYPTEPTEPEPLRTRIVQWLDETDHESPAAQAALREHLAELPSDDDLPAHLVHNDFRSANILCEYGKVVAVLDFEEIAYDHRVVDVAHGMVMLATRFRNWGPTPPDVQERFLTGYRSVHPLSTSELSWLRALVLWRSLRNNWPVP